MILYTDSELSEIKNNIDSNIFKFKLTTNNLIFSKSGKYLIQRVQNKFLGLAYNLEEKTFIFNYPHISNKSERDQIIEGFIEPKYNGTNYAYLIDEKENIYFRTRGSINPEIILNTINSAIISNQQISGITSDVFTSWKTKYIPVFNKGKELEYIDQFGNFVLKNVNEQIKDKLSSIIANRINGFNINGRKIVGIFGELISPYNPIAIDNNIKFGQYINLNKPFTFVIFDILVYKPEKTDFYGNKTEGAYEFLEPNMLEILINGSDCIERIDYEKISKLDSMLDKYDAEEGLVIKTKDRYVKFKRKDVLEWERMMGKLSNVMKFSIEHITSELGFSKEEVIDKNVYSSKEYINEVKVSIWNEIQSYNITKEDLVSYYKSESSMYDNFNSFLENSVITGIASVLASTGVSKEKLYLEIPKYYYFQNNQLVYDEKRGKMLPATKRYSSLVSRIIGRVY
jgi:hypothetical protein